jgi:hypothetical protein
VVQQGRKVKHLQRQGWQMLEFWASRAGEYPFSTLLGAMVTRRTTLADKLIIDRHDRFSKSGSISWPHLKEERGLETNKDIHFSSVFRVANAKSASACTLLCPLCKGSFEYPTKMRISCRSKRESYAFPPTQSAVTVNNE